LILIHLAFVLNKPVLYLFLENIDQKNCIQRKNSIEAGNANAI